MSNPYKNLGSGAYWRTGVAGRQPLDPGEVYRPKFLVTRNMRIATAGSCFAQHVGRALKGAGFDVLDYEAFPTGWDQAAAARFGFGVYSARYGNIYTSRQLLQLYEEANGDFLPALTVWENNGRFFDAMRPSVEPSGLETPESVSRHRQLHLARVKALFDDCDLFIFTFGLTEAWLHTESDTVYPTAPGVIAGAYDPKVFVFKNFTHDEVLSDFETLMTRMRERNPEIKFLVTTSPVPLTATASGLHVEVATAYSKSVLRGVCGELYQKHANVDYFPSYEIITSLNTRGVYFEANRRSVSALGVQTAMKTFLDAQGATDGPLSVTNDVAKDTETYSLEVVCEEALLETLAE